MQGVVGISEIIIKPGLVNVDFADVRQANMICGEIEQPIVLKHNTIVPRRCPRENDTVVRLVLRELRLSRNLFRRETEFY